MDAHVAIMGIAGIVILSYFFNLISKRFNIPSVLMLITVGIVIQLVWQTEVSQQGGLILQILPILGTIGIIMIALEAALDLKLEKEKKGLIFRSFLAAICILILTTFLVACVLSFFLNMPAMIALIHAVPLSIMSSAIVIPSIGHLTEKKKEFMIYESTFSDIIGIMVFYFLIDGYDKETAGEVVGSIFLNIGVTLAAAIVLGFAMIIVFQRIKETVGLFFLISILIFIYSFGKMFHLSSLLIIFFFGLMVNNQKLFFRGPLQRFIKEDTFSHMFEHFKLVIEESSFIVRTFFFVVFGMSITLASIFNLEVLFISSILLGIMYVVRFLNLKFIRKTGSIFPELFIAPRGLITVLLFYAIPESILDESFDTGILLVVILVTSVIMMVGLLKFKPAEVSETQGDEVEAIDVSSLGSQEFSQEPSDETGKNFES